jgi:hypothetical protein
MPGGLIFLEESQAAKKYRKNTRRKCFFMTSKGLYDKVTKPIIIDKRMLGYSKLIYIR